MSKRRPANKSLDAYIIKGTNEVVRAGDCVLMRPSDSDNPPSVARVEKIESDIWNNVNVKVRWYYRPEESIDGRRQFHGAKELFLSKRFGVQSADTIEGRCTVHSLNDYSKLESVGDDDYFWRFKYNSATGRFKPDMVAVYCKCEMPYNPDDPMVPCEGCKDWFHPACVNMTSEQAMKVDHFCCPSCSSEDEDKNTLNSHVASPLAEAKVIALPLPHRPLFPGFSMSLYVKDPKLLALLAENPKRSASYAGAFLVKDEPGSDSTLISGSEAEKSIYELKGEALYKRLNEVGTLAQITTIQGDQVVLIGLQRLRITEMVSEDPLTVKVDHLKEKPYDKDDDVIRATYFEVTSTLRDVPKTSPLWRGHVQTYTQHVGDLDFARLADFGAAIPWANKLLCQRVLEELDVYKRLKLTLELVKKQMEISKIQESFAKEIEEKISGEQRRYLLNEQLKAIKEPGLETDHKTALSVAAKFRERLGPNKERCPAHVLQVIEEELMKLRLLEASSSKFNVTRNYLDWLTSLPWGHYSEENFDVQRAQQILDSGHYGLSDVKERILEFIAVGKLKLRGTAQGKVICLSGPPGVGKTSIGKSIARALNRKFYRFSVGGLADVAEIKGHRRTDVGAMPGKMVQCLKSVGTANPLVLIDEIDKLGRGHGDPASALLELLDPEENANFLDHYLDVPIDVSKVLFVCTANVVETIPKPLLDHMEIISLVGYITDEKMHIARDYLELTTQEACGVKPEQVEITDAALLTLIESYCREAGVRNLQKHIEKIYRKIALKLVRQGATSTVLVDSSSQKQYSKELDDVEHVAEEKNSILTNPGIDEAPSSAQASAEEPSEPAESSVNSQDKITAFDAEKVEPEQSYEKVIIDVANIADYVGKPVFRGEKIYDQTPIGVVMGLAWTPMGGSTFYIETARIEQGEGKGAVRLSGQLGYVMRESALIAHTVARAILQKKEPGNQFLANSYLHLHVPPGAMQKDGPSAGCAMITSMLSLALKKLVKKDLAMTGEVTLTGRVLPIGEVKEKAVAARRSGIKYIIFPEANRLDYDELNANVKKGLGVYFVDTYDQIFNIAFDEEKEAEK